MRFHYVWKKVSGDVSISADIAFATKGGEEHKKAMVMFRQSLDADSAYADLAAHVVGPDVGAIARSQGRGDA